MEFLSSWQRSSHYECPTRCESPIFHPRTYTSEIKMPASTPSPRCFLQTVVLLMLIAPALFGQEAPAAAGGSRPDPEGDDRRRVSSRYQIERVTGLSNWHELAVDMGQRTRIGWVAARVTGARRYDNEGVQFGLEAYPILSERIYAYLEASASPSEGVFLPLRLAAEPYINFSQGWEASAGLRYLEVPGRDVIVYTGTGAKYFGNYWLSFRPSFSVSQSGNSHTLAVTGRKYFSERYDYAGFTISRSSGADPDALDPLRFERATRLISHTARLERRQPIGQSRARARYGAGYEREEVASGRFRDHLSFFAGAEWFWK